MVVVARHRRQPHQDSRGLSQRTGRTSRSPPSRWTQRRRVAFGAVVVVGSIAATAACMLAAVVVTRRSHVLLSLRHVVTALLSTSTTFQAAKTSNLMSTSTTAPAVDVGTNSIMDVMPAVGLGTFLIPANQVGAALTSAVKMGYRRIDCAPVYFNEAAVGDALHRLVEEEKVVHRSELFVTSKLASPFHRREHVRPALEKTLRDLRLDYLDLFLIHWPVAFKYVPIPSDPTLRGWENEDIDDSDGGNNIDPNVSVRETWHAMEECVDAGLVKYIGVSNFPVALLHELLSQSRIRPAVNQCESHPYLPQHRLVEYCQQRGVHFQAYSPLGTAGYAGTLDTVEQNILDDPTIGAIAKSHNVSPSQVCLAWALQRNTSVVVKSTNPEHQKDNLQFPNRLKLTDDEMRRIQSMERRHRFFRPEDWWGSAGAVFD